MMAKNLFAAIHWSTDDADGYPIPEALIVVAESIEQAEELFSTHISLHGLDWDSYTMEMHLGEVAHLLMQAPEPIEDEDDYFG